MRIKRAAFLILPLALVPALTSTRADADPDPPCNTWEIEYSLAAQVQLSDTMMGAGDGFHTIGPGKLTLQFDNANSAPANNVKVTNYEMTDQFTVSAKVFGLGTTVNNDTKTTTTPNICGVSAQGTLTPDNRMVRWSTLWNGMRTDGHLVCNGSMCGRMGAPPSGRSDVHQPAHPVSFKPFEFAPDLKTFRMDYSITAKSTSPSQTSRITFNGRETKRSCIYVKPCP